MKQSAGKVAFGWKGDRLVCLEGPGLGETLLYWVSTWESPEAAEAVFKPLSRWTDHWHAGETRAGWSRDARVSVQAAQDGPETDVVCVMRCAPGAPGAPIALPEFTKTAAHNVAELKPVD